MLLVQKKSEPDSSEINEATRLFSGLADLDFEPGYNDHMYFQYLSNILEKGFTVVDHPSEVYRIPDAHEYIDESLPLRLVLDIDARQKPDPMNPKYPSLDEYKIS
ncbi:2120_t:CDS:2, partial [Racocetra persica]